jgi:hypothetical protein
MKSVKRSALVMTLGVSAVAATSTDSFDQSPIGKSPADWSCGVTGGGAPKWTVEADASAPSPPNVLKQSDGDNYYVARANALENNVSLYHTQQGRRTTIKYVDAPVASNQWHQLRVEFGGRHIQVLLDGKPYISVGDNHIAGPGSVGVWTKVDSVTAFDDFSFGGK